MTEDERIEVLLEMYDDLKHELRIHMQGVVEYIGEHPELTGHENQIIHSYKSRIKDRDHLRDKLIRKISEGRDINTENLFQEVTDLSGGIILHLFQEGFADIDRIIRGRVAAGDWVLGEQPKAYSWDPEALVFFSNFDLETIEKPSSYTSVHYLIRPRADSPICCELQVRTLFEEIWGEVDHQLNYPVPTESIALKEQLKVLSKIVGAGSRLLDSIRRVQGAEDDAD